jgi:hypothetical protein
MVATYEPVKIQLTRPAKDYDGIWIYGCDPDTFVAQQIALIAPERKSTQAGTTEPISIS